MALILPPPPLKAQQDNFAWQDWYNRLYKQLSTEGALQWTQLDFSNSNLSDIQTRPHAALTGIQGGVAGERYHLSAAQYTNLTNIPSYSTLVVTTKNYSNPSWITSLAGSKITESILNMSGGIATPDYVSFNTSYATALTAGQLGWDGNNTLGLGMAGGNVIQRIGEDQYFYVKASSAITKGQVCMFTGSVGASGVVSAAPATGVTNGQYVMGIAAENIALNEFGLIQCFGTLRNVNTSAFSEGAVLYYDNTVTGGLTTTYPTSGPIVTVAAVVHTGTANGILQIRTSVTQRLSGGTGISVSQTSSNTTITNTINLSSPPAIGNTTPSTGAFTDLSASGTMKFGTYTAATGLTISGYITITDSGGTTRQLAVV